MTPRHADLAYDPAALALDAAAAEGACRLVAGAAAHEMAANPYPDPGDPRNRAFLRAFAWQFRAEVSRVTGHETSAARAAESARHPGRGRSRTGPRREFGAAETALLVAAAGVLPHAEVGAAFGVSAQSVRNRLHRWRKGRG